MIQYLLMGMAMGGAGGGMGMGGGCGFMRRFDDESFKDQKVNWQTVRKVFALARPYRGLLIRFGIASAVGAVAGTVPPLFFRLVIDKALKPPGNLGLLAQLSLAAIAFNVANQALKLYQRWQASQVAAGLTYDMRMRVHDHVVDMPMGFVTSTQTGALMSRLNNDVQGAQQVLTDIIDSATSDTFAIVSTVAAMLVLDWQLTLVVLSMVPVFIIPGRYMGRRLQQITRERFTLLSDMNTFLHERLSVGGAMLGRLDGDPRQEHQDYDEHAGAVREITVRTGLVTGLYVLAMGGFATMSTSIVYWVGGWRSITSGLSIGTVVAFGSYAQRAYTPVNSITGTRISLMTALVSFERVFEVLEFPNSMPDRPGAVELVDPRGEVRFEAVAFAYPTPSESTLESLQHPGMAVHDASEARQILTDVSFSAPPGSVVAVVGPTGAGKTTTLALVPRLYDVSAGAVLVDGHDVRDLTKASLRRCVGVVSQDPHLFHDSLAVNLRYAKPDATDAEIEAACRVARIWDLVQALPDGLDTIAGERGYRLSGGEKQRLSIARLILKDPRIVILDEATSHLDSENERLIQEALAEVLRGRTTLVIAHRLSTIVAADQILVLDQGRIVERGTHADLVANGGLYATLCATQFSRVEPIPESTNNHTKENHMSDASPAAGRGAKLRAALQTVNLTDDQQGKIQALFASARANAGAGGQAGGQRGEVLRQLGEILTPEQLASVRQTMQAG